MKKIDLTSDARQKLTVLTDDNKQVVLELTYKPNQLGWFCDLNYGDFSLCGFRLTNCPNLLNAWSDILPFGLCCYVLQKSEPFLKEDFLNGRATLYLINSEDVQAVKEDIYA